MVRIRGNDNLNAYYLRTNRFIGLVRQVSSSRRWVDPSHRMGESSVNPAGAALMGIGQHLELPP
ncbi:hypothetical protein ACLM45_12785 [Synechococcus sp. A10-1-5-9]|uniref:hypothetical protein n=1 Tax=Synechococcus sp. A10-1-5-9 TaxID=3392295 RepID=UPI0039E73311